MARSAGVEDQEVGERCAVGQGGSRGSRPDRWNPGQADPLLTPLLRGMEAHGSSKRCPGGEDDRKIRKILFYENVPGTAWANGVCTNCMGEWGLPPTPQTVWT